MKITKINNPLWVANMAPVVQKLMDKINMPNMNYYSAITYFQNIAQFGGEGHELHVVTDDKEEIVGFASWLLRGPPYVATTFMEFIYSKRAGAVELLLGEFEAFADRHNAVYGMFDLTNEGKLADHFQKLAGKQGYTIGEAPFTSFLVRKIGE